MSDAQAVTCTRPKTSLQRDSCINYLTLNPHNGPRRPLVSVKKSRGELMPGRGPCQIGLDKVLEIVAVPSANFGHETAEL